MRYFNFSNWTTEHVECAIRLRYEVYPLDYGYYVCGPILTALILIGLSGNLMCLIIFYQTRPVPVTTFYTVPLCVCDCAVLLGSFIMTNLPHLLYGRMRTYGPYVPLYPVSNFLSNFAYTSCVWLVVLLSIERYFALCHPLKHKIYDAKKRSIFISILALIIAILYNIPRYFEIRTFRCFEWTKREMVDLMEPTPFRSFKSYWIAYKIILGPLLFSLGPFVLLCILSVRIWREVRRTRLMVLRRKSRYMLDDRQDTVSEALSMQDAMNIQNYQHNEALSKKSSGSQRSQYSNLEQKYDAALNGQRKVLSYTLLCVILKFLICHTLPAVIDFCETFMDAQQFQQSFMEDLVDTSTLLVVANSSLNFFIYAWCSGRFRRKMRGVLRHRNSEDWRQTLAT